MRAVSIEEYTKIEKDSRLLKIDINACCVISYHCDGEAGHHRYAIVTYL